MCADKFADERSRKVANAFQKIFASFTPQMRLQVRCLRCETTAGDTAPERYYGPERLFQLKGDPVEIPLPRPALDQSAARRLWSLSEELTRVSFAGL
jgi:hypothetical protein